MRDIWPELAEALSDPSLAAELEKNGLVADMDKIRQLGEAGIFIAVASDGRARFSNLKRKEKKPVLANEVQEHLRGTRRGGK
jgi:hypothetical protein